MSIKRNVFYSFHYKPDAQRAAKVRNIGVLEGNRPAADNTWEEVTKGGDAAIEKWIKGQMKGRSCSVILVGAETAKRKWIDYEIIESWNKGMGVVGIRIHGLKNLKGQVSTKGANPFAHLKFESGKALSSVVKCYDPAGTDSKAVYAWISKHLANAVEEAITIRKNF